LRLKSNHLHISIRFVKYLLIPIFASCAYKMNSFHKFHSLKLKQKEKKNPIILLFLCIRSPYPFMISTAIISRVSKHNNISSILRNFLYFSIENRFFFFLLFCQLYWTLIHIYFYIYFLLLNSFNLTTHTALKNNWHKFSKLNFNCRRTLELIYFFFSFLFLNFLLWIKFSYNFLFSFSIKKCLFFLFFFRNISIFFALFFI
jgi:hypothetical protein